MSQENGHGRAINIAIITLFVMGGLGVVLNHFYQKSHEAKINAAVKIERTAANKVAANLSADESTNKASDADITTELVKRPDFTLPDVEGIKRTVSTWDGKVLVLNFWASWCEPCLREIPAFVDLQNTYGEQGLQFVGIAIENLLPVQEFLAVIPINYPILVHPSKTIPVAEAYGNEFGILPYTVIINRDSEIAHTQLGAISHEDAEEIIKKLL
ncbi:MAG: TlpA family protein disulfide reductase [Thiotrichales bacterium]|nr:TlpA family protein disulfide reductase [Thiotrichales bacterium]